MSKSENPDFPTELGCIDSIPRKQLFSGRTSLEFMPMLTKHCGGGRLFVKRDDCTGLAFGGNKARQLEFYLGAAHAGLLFGLRALDSTIKVTGVCVRRDAALQQARIRETCNLIGKLLAVESRVTIADINLVDDFVAPGYGIPGDATLRAIVLGAQTEGLMLDPVYTGKVMAAVVKFAKSADASSTFVFIHTGGSPALFAYQTSIEKALSGTVGAE